MTTPRLAPLFRRAQWALLALLTLWVAVHTVFIWSSGWSAWRLGGMGMYSEPTRRYAAAALVECRSAGCRSELRNASVFALRIRDASLLLLRAEPGGTYERYELAGDETPGDVSEVLRSFLTFPSADNARRLLVATIERPCASHLAVRYRQYVSVIRREAYVQSRPFVVGAEKSCPSD